MVAPHVQLLQRCEVADGLREAAELVSRNVQILQHSELAEALREAAELVCRKVQITKLAVAAVDVDVADVAVAPLISLIGLATGI